MTDFLWMAFYSMALFPLLLESLRILGVNAYLISEISRLRKLHRKRLDELSSELSLETDKKREDVAGCVHSLLLIVLWMLGGISFAWKIAGAILIGSTPFILLCVNSVLFTIVGFFFIPYVLKVAREEKKKPVLMSLFYILTGMITVVLTVFAVAQGLLKN